MGMWAYGIKPKKEVRGKIDYSQIYMSNDIVEDIRSRKVSW